MRRLLLLPAFLLVVLGGPVLAVDGPTPPTASTDEVPVVPEDQTVQAGWRSARTPVDAQLVGVTWDGDPDAEFTVEVQRGSSTWTKPTEVEDGGEPDEGTQDAVAAASADRPDQVSEPVWVGDGVTAVRVKLTSGAAADVTIAAVSSEPGNAPAGTAGAIAGWFGAEQGPARYAFALALLGIATVLVAVAFGWSPHRRLLALLVLAPLLTAACVPLPPPPGPSPSSSIPNGLVGPPIYERASWGARPFGTGPVPCAAPEYAPALELGIVHHTVNSNGYSHSQVPAMLRSIQAYHMDVNGYCDVAYNILIDSSGWVWEGRAGGVTRPVIGGHAGGFNTRSVGVALIGTFTSVQPTGPQWDALVHFLRWRFSVANVSTTSPYWHTVASSPCNCQNWPPGTVVPFSNRIVWHRTVDQTACPGNAFAPRLAELQNEVAAGVVLTPTTTTTVPPPSTTTSTSTTTTTVPVTTTTTHS